MALQEVNMADILVDLTAVANHIHEGPPELSRRDRALDRQGTLNLLDHAI